ncbi:hypothetical protein D8X55_00325 [Malacoplasma penetrans]|uniref:Uncharacterized protein n=1 Tax=Malacoplasma penetrans (strain HF-2) TaxID=272633 RepID=Q8EWZ5_MALP2|nr:hypothetical protein D8X55_00325 [Malacoplasma penetrans]BAC43845.1 hypothetical protein [Malacoplasma penetrans HF-2]
MNLKIFSTPKFSILFYSLFFTLSLVIAFIIGFTYQIQFLYSYLINVSFIILAIVLILSLDKKLLLTFIKKESLPRRKKIQFIFTWKIKWISLVLLFVCSIILISQKIIFINNFGLLYSAIILIIILIISEILKLIKLRYIDLE